jgi:hypothetical protein
MGVLGVLRDQVAWGVLRARALWVGFGRRFDSFIWHQECNVLLSSEETKSGTYRFGNSGEVSPQVILNLCEAVS